MPTVTLTIDSGGGEDYTTLTDWEADLDDAGVYDAGDDAVGKVVAGYYDEALAINGGGTLGLDSITLEPADGEEHDGTAGTGAGIVRTISSSIVLSIASAVDTSVLGLEIDGTQLGHLVTVLPSAGTGVTHAIQRCVIHGMNRFASGADANLIRAMGVGTVTLANNILYDYARRNSSGAGACLRIAATGGTHHYFNNTIHNVRSEAPDSGNAIYGISVAGDNANRALKNNHVTGVVNEAGAGDALDYHYQSGDSLIDHEYNASEDATATGDNSITGVDPADEFVSTVEGAEDYHLVTGAVAIDAGLDIGNSPAGVAIDIDGRDRDAEADVWDIGADEWVSSGPTGILALSVLVSLALSGAVIGPPPASVSIGPLLPGLAIDAALPAASITPLRPAVSITVLD
jgi:hypothetical protein